MYFIVIVALCGVKRAIIYLLDFIFFQSSFPRSRSIFREEAFFIFAIVLTRLIGTFLFILTVSLTMQLFLGAIRTLAIPVHS
jgi:hypothetical protein